MTGRGKLSRTARSRKFDPFRSASRWAERFLSGVVAVRGLVHLCQRFARRSQVVIGVYRSSAVNDARKLWAACPRSMKANGTRDTNRFFTPSHDQDDIPRNFNPRPPPGVFPSCARRQSMTGCWCLHSLTSQCRDKCQHTVRQCHTTN